MIQKVKEKTIPLNCNSIPLKYQKENQSCANKVAELLRIFDK